ncbi:hypothetical protein PHYBOEH_005567 [Phytophthora boehmeriae]|uniref:Hom-end-associated Hint domain-containing protein n=1 Tax=Phytophthora boehmeriae TaxID=109152 RepID=A0A8T1WQG2_9STRA|nr:hypothetical protein PHYBOEH_005567 [Phytophthora boehmeriae]
MFPNPIYTISVNHPEERSIVTKTAYVLNAASRARMEAEMNDTRRFQVAYDKAYSTYLQTLVIDPDIKHMWAMLNILSPDRFTSVDAWLEIIKSLAADPIMNRFHCLAVMITKDRNSLIKAGRMNEPMTWDEFEQHWDDAINSNDYLLYSPSSIHYWASCDSPSHMHRYKIQTIRAMIISDIRHPVICGKLNHTQYAGYLHFMFENVFVTKDVAKSASEWYEFVTPKTSDIELGQIYKWRRLGCPPDSLSMYMTTGLKDIVTAIYTDMKALCSTTSDKEKDSKQKLIHTLSKTFLSKIEMLFIYGHKENIIKDSARLFRRNTFINQMDKTAHIIGVGNGVLEFCGPKVKLIRHFHTYPISLYTDTKYVPYNPDNKYVKIILRVLTSLVPNNEMDALEFLIYYLCTSLDAMPKESLFLIIHGGGCHAINTPIRMYDGSVKLVQDVVVGDQLMGDDSTPRNVQELFRGTDDMYRITPHEGNFFEVNKDHVLSLRFSDATSIMKQTNGWYNATWYEHNGSQIPELRFAVMLTKAEALERIAASNNLVKEGDIIDIKVKDLLTWPAWWLEERKVLLYKSGNAKGTQTLFSIEPIGKGDYYGFELDGNHRYLDCESYVHHNSNDKTVLMELFRRTLGEMYVRKMPLSFITEQSRTSSAAADPAIMELKNARLVYYSESDRNEKVNVAKVKEITGGETLAGRQLFKEMENFTANCNHIVTTNHRFVIETTEHAVWRRFISYKFKICFKLEQDCNPNDPLERPRNTKLIDKIKRDKRYQEAFLSILIHYRSRLYSEYDGQILNVPHPTIIRETNQYRQEEDIYQRYIMNNVYYSEGTEHPLHTLVNNFREYYRLEGGGQYSGKTIDTVHIFRNTLLQPYCREVGGKHILLNFITVSVTEGVPDDAVTFQAWRDSRKNDKRSQTSAEQ